MIFGTLSFDLKDAIDIILVALLLFYIYRLMRASSSSNIFTGVLVFIIVWIFVSQFLKMRLLGSIFDRLINVGALAPNAPRSSCDGCADTARTKACITKTSWRS